MHKKVVCMLWIHNLDIQVLVAYGYDWNEAPEWYKETWSKSKKLMLGVLSVFNCFVFAFLQRLMFLSVGMIPKPVKNSTYHLLCP